LSSKIFHQVHLHFGCFTVQQVGAASQVLQPQPQSDTGAAGQQGVTTGQAG